VLGCSSGLLVLAAVGCSTGGNASDATDSPAIPTSAPAGLASASAVPTSTGPASTGSASPSATLDGSTLYSLLLPGSAMPKGFQIDSSGTRNSGQALPQDASQPVSAKQACNLLTGTSWILAGGINSSDFAENDYTNASKTEEIAQEVDFFQPGDATKVMSRLWQVFGRCRSFTQQAAGTTAKTSTTRTRLRKVGNGGIKAVELSPVLDGGTTLVAIRVGDAIVTCLDSSAGSDDGAAAVTLAKHIAQRVRAAQQSG
jgi:hypothetical protein